MNIQDKKRKIIYKIIIAIVVIVIGVILVNNFKKDHYYRTLVRIGIIKRCDSPPENFLDIFNQEGLDYEIENERAISSSLDKLSDNNIHNEDKLKIPAITHRVYFVPEHRTSELEVFYVEQMRINFSKLNELGEDWQHNIWINNPKFIPQDIRDIEGVRVRSILELDGHPLYSKLLELINLGNNRIAYLAEASDLLRLMILQKFGGVYADMDYEIYNPSELLKLMKKFDFIGGREHLGVHSYYGNAFIATKPSHPILNESIKMSLRNRAKNLSDPKLPYYIKYPCKMSDELYFNGPPLITISYFRKNNIDGNNDVILPPWMIFNGSFARYKNETCDFDNITKDLFYSKDTNLDILLNKFIDNPRINGPVIGEVVRKPGKRNSFEDYNNIYYNIENRIEYPIIGADMFCGGWNKGQVFRKIYYWNWPWSK